MAVLKDAQAGDGAVTGSLRGPEQPPLPAIPARTTGQMHPITLSFCDAPLESKFREHSFRSNLTNIRAAHVLGIVLWVVWGFLIHDYLESDRIF